MIAEFKIQNYLSVKSEQILSFEPTTDTLMKDEYTVEVKDNVRLLKTGLIYGANASGKTNLLQALSFFRELITDNPKDKTQKLKVIPFLLNDSSKNESTVFSLSFYAEKEKYVLMLKVDANRIYEETLTCYPGAQPAKLYSRTYNPYTDATEIEFGNKLGISKKNQQIISGNTINNCSVLAAFGKSNVELSRLNVVYNYFAHQMGSMLKPNDSLLTYVKNSLSEDTDGQLKEFLTDMLKASDFNITGLHLRKEEEDISPAIEKMIVSSDLPAYITQNMLRQGKITNYELQFKHSVNGEEYELPENLESRGTIRFMGMVVLLKQLLFDNKIIVIDEVETSLHYELLAYFLKVFLANSTQNSQLIMTTHDINLLNESFVRRDTIWFADKDKCGETKLVRLSSLGLHKNLSPYNAYKQGKLIDLPFFESIYIKHK